MAVEEGHTEAATALIEAGAWLEAQDDGKWRPLHVAAHQGHARVVKALVDAGAALDAQADGRWTPLHWAAHQGQTAAVRALIEAGASLDARADGNHTPLDMASNEESRQVLIDARNHGLRLLGASSGVLALLAELEMDEFVPAATKWLHDAGVTSIDELVALELIDEFVDALDLKPVPAWKLAKTLMQRRDQREKEEL